jgi:hypothetical protein
MLATKACQSTSNQLDSEQQGRRTLQSPGRVEGYKHESHLFSFDWQNRFWPQARRRLFSHEPFCGAGICGDAGVGAGTHVCATWRRWWGRWRTRGWWRRRFARRRDEWWRVAREQWFFGISQRERARWFGRRTFSNEYDGVNWIEPLVEPVSRRQREFIRFERRLDFGSRFDRSVRREQQHVGGTTGGWRSWCGSGECGERKCDCAARRDCKSATRAGTAAADRRGALLSI